MVQFSKSGSANLGHDRFFGNPGERKHTSNKKTVGLFGSCEEKAKSKVNDNGSVPGLQRMRTMGAKVYDRRGSVVVDFGRGLTARRIDADFVKSVISECSGEGCDLINVSEQPLWDVEQISANKFMIKKVN